MNLWHFVASGIGSAAGFLLSGPRVRYLARRAARFIAVTRIFNRFPDQGEYGKDWFVSRGHRRQPTVRLRVQLMYADADGGAVLKERSKPWQNIVGVVVACRYGHVVLQFRRFK